MRLRFILLCVVLAVPAQQAFAQPSPVRECDRLAADRFDPGKPADVIGVLVDDIDADRAVPACEAAIGVEPETGRVWYQLGLALMMAGREVDSLKALGTAVEKGHVAARTGIGFIHMNGSAGLPKDNEAALAEFRAAAEAGHAIAEGNIGLMYAYGLGVGQSDAEAEVWFRRAADKGFPGAMNGLAWLWLLQGKNLVEAEALARRAVEAQPGNGDALDTLGLAIFKQGRNAEALEFLTRATAANPACAVCHDHMGDALLALGDPQGAQAAWRKAIALPDPMEPSWDRKAVEAKIDSTGP